jgi:acetolactate synthase I/III small subunit
VLARVAALFSRRGYNIESLAVGATEQKDMSRMTIVVSVEDLLPLEQITKQLNKLINVIKIVEQDADNSVSRELALIKVRADATTRGQVIEAVNLFRAKVVDVSNESLTVEATGTPGKLEALLRVLEPYGIREIVQSGVVSLSRGPRGIGTAK